MKRIITLVVALSALAVPVLTSCAQASATPTSGTLAPAEGEDNPCAYVAPEVIPTPGPPTPTPTPTPSPEPRTPTPTPLIGEPEISTYPDLPSPSLPEAVETWQDAIVHIAVDRVGASTRDQDGLVIDPSGGVLTVLSALDTIKAVTVEVPGRGVFPAEVQRFDPRTGAALLAIEADNLATTPSDVSGVALGEPVLLLSRDATDGSLTVQEAFASPSVNAPEHLFALLIAYAPYQRMGTVVVSRSGTPIGLVGGMRSWWGAQVPPSGPPPGPNQPVVLLSSALQLPDTASTQDKSIPAAVAYHGLNRGGFIDGPITREVIAQPVQEALRRLSEPVSIEGLGQRARRIIGSGSPWSGTVLELLYAQPQELRTADGELLGSGRYIVLWWDRGEAEPDLVLCGTEPDYLGAAFAASDLTFVEPIVEQAPRSTRSVVKAEPLPKLSRYSQYPYQWSLKQDQEEYSPGQVVTLTFTVTNVSQWPMPLDYLPPTVTFRSTLDRQYVAAVQHGDEHRILAPDETVSLLVTWDQADVMGRQAPPGRYVAEVSIANTSHRFWLSSGPRTEFVLLP